MSLLLAVVVFLAGAVAAPAAGWEATQRLLGLEPGPGRRLLVASAEAVVGLGTGTLGLVLAAWLVPAQTLALVAAATAGVGIGLRRQLAAFGAAGRRAQVGTDEARVVEALRTVVVYGGAARVVGVAAVLVGVLVAVYGPA